MSVLIVGSVALDSVITPIEKHDDLLGGSASFAAVSASFFSPVNLVGVVGDDFPKEHIAYFQSRNVDLSGLQIVPGATMRWTGEYEWDLNVRHTRHIALNVFEHFTPVIPESFKKPAITLLANIAPGLQSHVLDQVPEPRFVIADTMDLWINIAAGDLANLLKRVDLLILNDSEARLLTKDNSLIRAARTIQDMGPKYVAIKKGEHGCLLFGPSAFFSCGAYPLEEIRDPTGAGDTFAGGFAGYLASLPPDGEIAFSQLKQAVVHGSVMASFNVEAFSLERLRTLDAAQIAERYKGFQTMTDFTSLS
ncbi:MAG TPA: PfkB family carbohydrate kinase [Chthoniobacterales bacterium]